MLLGSHRVTSESVPKIFLCADDKDKGGKGGKGAKGGSKGGKGKKKKGEKEDSLPKILPVSFQKGAREDTKIGT